MKKFISTTLCLVFLTLFYDHGNSQVLNRARVLLMGKHGGTISLEELQKADSVYVGIVNISNRDVYLRVKKFTLMVNIGEKNLSSKDSVNVITLIKSDSKRITKDMKCLLKRVKAGDKIGICTISVTGAGIGEKQAPDVFFTVTE